jgi:hypothetical protein
MHKRLKENGTIPSFDLEGLQCLGSMLRIVGLSGTHMDLSNISIQWFRIHPKESNKEIISGGIMLCLRLGHWLLSYLCIKFRVPVLFTSFVLNLFRCHKTSICSRATWCWTLFASWNRCWRWNCSSKDSWTSRPWFVWLDAFGEHYLYVLVIAWLTCVYYCWQMLDWLIMWRHS